MMSYQIEVNKYTPKDFQIMQKNKPMDHLIEIIYA